MKEIEQSITGDNNVQVGVNNGQIIHTKKVKVTTEVLHAPGQHITNEQAFQIKAKVTEIANMVATNGTTTAKAFSSEWTAFKNKFKCTKYELLPNDKFDIAMVWLQQRVALVGKKALRHGDNDEWRKKQYTAINTRARQLGMDRDKMIMFAQDKLELKEPLESIKDLSSTRLEKLYKFIFALKTK